MQNRRRELWFTDVSLRHSSFRISHSSFFESTPMSTRPFAEVTAADIMHADPIVVGPDNSLAELRHLLIQSQITGVPVVSKGQLVGIISRSDLVRIEEMLETLDEQVGDRETWLDNE